MTSRFARIPMVVLSGSSRERGRQHGALFKHQIHRAIEAMIAFRGQEATAYGLNRARDILSSLLAVAPEETDEILGIAEGAALDPEMAVLRAAFELFRKPQEIYGCSAVGFARSEGALLAQNWDAPEQQLSDLVCFHHVEAGRPQVMTVASVGGLCWVGMNEQGLSLVNNDLVLRGTGIGIPSQIARRQMLTTTNVEAAVGRIRRLTAISGRSYVLGDRHGSVIGVEVSAQGIAIVAPKDGRVIHTNHALDDKIAADEDYSALEQTYPSTWARYNRLYELAASMRHPSAAVVVDALEDHAGFPDSICKHASVNEPTGTCFAIVCDSAACAVHIKAGNPCSGATFHTLQFAKGS